MTRAKDAYPVPARIYRVEDVVRRSRFVTTVAHAPEAHAAHAFVQRIREEMPGATHHCWAFVAGPPGSARVIGMSDDGEPHGTAGRPMLTVLLHSGVGEIVAVSARWFGGTELGTGGLARAYAGGVTRALEALPTEWRTPRDTVEIVVSYPHVDALRRLLDEVDARVRVEDYGAEVRYEVTLPTSLRPEFVRRLAGVTRGEAVVRDVQ